MIFLLIALLLIVLIGPNLWVKRVLKKYSKPRPDLSGTGGELADHLIKRFHLNEVKLEEIPSGDSYNPIDKTVRLTPHVMNEKSLTAVATAAHEVGHAMQHSMGDKRLTNRTQLAKTAAAIQAIAQVALLILPFVSLLPFLHPLAFLLLVIVLLSMFVNTLVHLATLPVEFDASFGKAYPVLVDGEYLDKKDLKAVKKILRACALTYVSQAAIGLLNIYNWLRIIRR